MNTSAEFIKKQDRLNIAISKVSAKLMRYASEAAKITENRPYEIALKFADWNNLHDLQYRLECRLKDNYVNYQEWHFNAFGWSAY
jgi:phosphate-selective porin